MGHNGTSTGVLSGKVAVVTGATSGSGRAIATRFAEEGASIFLLARGADRLRDLEAQLGDAVTGIPTDVGDAASVTAAFDQIRERHGRLDILINNAAIYRPCPVDSLSDDEIAHQVRTNFLGPVYTCRAAIPLLRAAGGGDIINTSSESTIDPFPMLSIYVATKAALEAFSQVLRSEVERDGIRVTTLLQGAAAGEGGGSTGWEWDPVQAADALRLWESEGFLRRIQGSHGGQSVRQIADVHLFVVTLPVGQKVEVLRCRSY
jgi:NAD(P)-dependent dehydrogenase (short-subunit alcohol dehydrogenase family)